MAEPARQVRGHLLTGPVLDWLRRGLSQGGVLPLLTAEGGRCVTDAELGWCLVLGLVRQPTEDEIAAQPEPPAGGAMQLTVVGRQVLRPQRPLGLGGLTLRERAAREGGA